MKCVNHQEAEAQALCVICNAPVCEECLVRLGSKEYCRSCLEKRVDALEGTRRSDRSAMLAFLFSLLPGAGYMYLGLMNRGLQVMVLFFGAIFLAGMSGLDLILPLALPVIYFYNIFDTLQLAGRMRDGVPVEDKPLVDLQAEYNKTGLLGYALVGLGILALLNNFLPHLFHYSFFSLMKQIFAPLVIIVLGVFILYRNLKRGKEDGGRGDE